MQAFYGFPQRGSGAALNLCCVRLKSHSRWCLNTSSRPQPAENPSLLDHRWKIRISTCRSSREAMVGPSLSPPCHPPAPGPPPAAPFVPPPLPSPVCGNDPRPRARTDPQHNSSSSRVFQNPHRTAVPGLPPSMGSTENQTSTARAVKISPRVAPAAMRNSGSHPGASPGPAEHPRHPGHPALRDLGSPGAAGAGRRIKGEVAAGTVKFLP